MNRTKKRYNINELTRETFYQLPKVFFTQHGNYQKLSLTAAVAFSFLKDRFNYSIKNHWVDEHGDIFFIFTNKELGETLKIKSSATVVKIKKELEQFGLLEQQRMGLNQPNRLYLLQPEVTATDVYEINNEAQASQSLQPQGSLKNELPEKEPQSLQPQGSLKNELPENSPQSLQPQGSLKNEHNQYKELEDTNKIPNDTQLNFTSSNYSSAQIAEQNKDLINHINETMNTKADPNFISESSLQLIKLWCNTPAQINRFIRIILNAKNSVRQEVIANGYGNNVNLDLDSAELQSLLTKWIRSYFDRIRAADSDPKKQVKNAENYLYTTMRNNFSKYTHSLLQQDFKD